MAHPVLTVTPISGEVPLTVVASLHDTDGDNLLGTVTWDWGNGAPHGSGLDVTYTYEAVGIYNLTATSLEGEWTQTVQVIVFEAAPVAVDDTYSVRVNTSLTANTADNDAAGPNLSAISRQIVTDPMHGTIDSWPGNGIFTYTPTTDYIGTDSFQYQLTNFNTGDQSAVATVTLNVEASTNGPAIKAWYNGKLVYLGLDANSLVFDGSEFVRPQDAKLVAIVETTTVGPINLFAPWSETATLPQAALTWTNMWLCTVVAVDQTPIADHDVVTVIDEHNGACICGVSCNGTELQYVQVVDVTP